MVVDDAASNADPTDDDRRLPILPRQRQATARGDSRMPAASTPCHDDEKPDEKENRDHRCH